MSHEFILWGIVLSPIIPACLLALLLTGLTSLVLVRLRLYRFVWRRPLAEAAMFCIWLALITTLPLVPGTR